MYTGHYKCKRNWDIVSLEELLWGEKCYRKCQGVVHSWNFAQKDTWVCLLATIWTWTILQILQMLEIKLHVSITIDKVFLSVSSVVQDITKAGEKAQKWVLSFLCMQVGKNPGDVMFLWQLELLKSSRVPYGVCRHGRRHSGGCIVFEWWLWTREVN